MANPTALTIGTLANLAGVSVETIRFYQRKGLLARPVRPPRGARRYPLSSVDRVRFIKAAQSWGFSLAEISELLRLEDGTSCDDVRRIAEARLVTVRARVLDLQRMAKVLESAIASCRTRRGLVSCPLITALRPAPLGSRP